MRTPLIESRPEGLYCPKGDFYVDPWAPVKRAVVTHAHGDHARWGSKSYLTAAPGGGVLRKRMGPDAVIETLSYKEECRIGDVAVSFFPAGHLLGSGQVRIEHQGEVWVVSGDYKTSPDPTCEPFEPARCHTFLSESTFALPIYRWPDQSKVRADVNAWWRANQARGVTSILFAYALGKAQHVLAGLDASIGPILVHGAVAGINEHYRAAGVPLPATQPADLVTAKAVRGQAMVIAPPSVRMSPWIRKFQPFSTAFASGWMRIRGARRRRALDRGFVLSDHADWDGLLWAIRETGAERIGVMHGNTGVLTRYLKEQGVDAYEIKTQYEGADEEEAMEPVPNTSEPVAEGQVEVP
jgi:putative mRNA 3-end processing factor